jgi:quercetin dioxygenase-like cupin family protein
VLAFDEGGRLEDNALDGPFTVQCLLGRVLLTIGGRENRLTTGDLLVAEAGIAHDISADEASVLLVTVSVAEA